MQITFNPKLFSPLHWHLMPLLRDPNIRFIFIEGGSSAAKTFEICRALLIDQMQHNYSTMVFRRFHVHIQDSVYASFKQAANSIQFQEFLTYNQDIIRFNGKQAVVRFRGLDDEENIKGIEGFNVVYNNEWSQFLKRHWDQQRKRLRGRANQKFICDWNPISEKLWQYEEWIDKEEWIDLPLDLPGAPTKYSGLNPEFSFKRINKNGNAVWIKVTYRDNFWVVGHPSGSGGFIDKNTLDDFEYDRIHNPNLYRVYANGERGIMRTGGEFWKQFDETRHVRPVKPERTTIHVSVDNNVTPYVTQTLWQFFPAVKEIKQIGELLCKTPENNAPKAARALARWLERIQYKDVLFVYGDPSIRARSTVDENNASFYEKYIAELIKCGVKVVSRVQKSAPEVALSAAFINEIYESNYEGWSITISDSCRESIQDYVVVKEDVDGTMKKTKVKDPESGVTYEPHGHISDTKRYIITTILASLFKSYKQRTKKVFGYAVG